MAEAVDGDGEGSNEAEIRRHRRLRRWIIAALAVVVLYTIPAVFTAHPRACAACHSMQEYYESWSQSRHRAAASDCLFCHAKPGTINRVIYRATVYKDILVVISNGKILPFRTSAVTDGSCTQVGCHSHNRLTSLSGNIRIDHRLHADEAEMICTDCHLGAGHDDVGGRSSNPPMDSCAECHEDSMENCRYCHIGRALPTKPEGD